MEKLKLSPPWQTYVSELEALFGKDPDIQVIYDDEEKIVKLYVDNSRKAEALAKLLPVEKEFGNVVLNIAVIPANDENEDEVSLLAKAFEGNPALADIKTVDSMLGSFNFVIFKKEVVQFYNDQLDDINGNKSTLYQEIAKDVLCTGPNIHYCTESDPAEGVSCTYTY